VNSTTLSATTPAVTSKLLANPEQSKVEPPKHKFSSRPNCWNCGEEGHPAWQCMKPKVEPKVRVQVTDLPEEDVMALAKIGLEVVEEEGKNPEDF
jgi:hypothetical protein